MLKRIFQMILPISSTDFDTQNEDLVRQKRQKVGGGELATNESNITLRADRKTKKNQLSPPPQEVPTPKLPGATGRCTSSHAIYSSEKPQDDWPSPKLRVWGRKRVDEFRLETSCEQNRASLYECFHDGDCDNKIIKDLNLDSLESFLTKDRGYGLRSSRYIERGQAIIEYTGEVLSEKQYAKQSKQYEKEGKCNEYMLGFRNGSQALYMDGTRGSLARLINHRCSPNCSLEKWIVQGYVRFVVFAIEPIRAGQEFTLHYGRERAPNPCLCGFTKCVSAKQGSDSHEVIIKRNSHSNGVVSEVKTGGNLIETTFAQVHESDKCQEISNNLIENDSQNRRPLDRHHSLSFANGIQTVKRGSNHQRRAQLSNLSKASTPPSHRGQIACSKEKTRAPHTSVEDDAELIWCKCRKKTYETPDKLQMVECGNEHCAIQWFHFECAQYKHLEEEPDAVWFCDSCEIGDHLMLDRGEGSSNYQPADYNRHCPEILGSPIDSIIREPKSAKNTPSKAAAHPSSHSRPRQQAKHRAKRDNSIPAKATVAKAPNSTTVASKYPQAPAIKSTTVVNLGDAHLGAELALIPQQAKPLPLAALVIDLTEAEEDREELDGVAIPGGTTQFAASFTAVNEVQKPQDRTKDISQAALRVPRATTSPKSLQFESKIGSKASLFQLPNSEVGEDKHTSSVQKCSSSRLTSANPQGNEDEIVSYIAYGPDEELFLNKFFKYSDLEDGWCKVMEDYYRNLQDCNRNRKIQDRPDRPHPPLPKRSVRGVKKYYYNHISLAEKKPTRPPWTEDEEKLLVRSSIKKEQFFDVFEEFLQNGGTRSLVSAGDHWRSKFGDWSERGLEKNMNKITEYLERMTGQDISYLESRLRKIESSPNDSGFMNDDPYSQPMK